MTFPIPHYAPPRALPLRCPKGVILPLPTGVCQTEHWSAERFIELPHRERIPYGYSDLEHEDEFGSYRRYDPIEKVNVLERSQNVTAVASVVTFTLICEILYTWVSPNVTTTHKIVSQHHRQTQRYKVRRLFTHQDLERFLKDDKNLVGHVWAPIIRADQLVLPAKT